MTVKVINAAIVKYNPILVMDKWRLAIIGASKLNKSLTSNWSKGLAMHILKGKLLFIKSKLLIII